MNNEYCNYYSEETLEKSACVKAYIKYCTVSILLNLVIDLYTLLCLSFGMEKKVEDLPDRSMEENVKAAKHDRLDKI